MYIKHIQCGFKRKHSKINRRNNKYEAERMTMCDNMGSTLRMCTVVKPFINRMSWPTLMENNNYLGQCNDMQYCCKL